jgi:long-chain acyl-CoA synthetase
VLFSVPTLYKRVFDGVHKKIEEEKSPVKKFLMKRAIDVGLKVNEITTAGGTVGPFLGFQHRFLDKLVLSKMRAPLGGRLRVAVVAGAPTPVAVLLFLEALGLKVTEGYGLTETVSSISHKFNCSLICFCVTC